MSLFYFFGGDGTDRAGLGGCCIPRRCTPAPSSAPGRTTPGRPYQMQGQTMQDTAHRHTRPDAGHAAPVCTRYQTAHTGQIVTAAGCLSVSETVQIWTHSNMNDFQHKNVCKTIDTNTRTCYYIDNTRTCYTTTKTGGQKP